MKILIIENIWIGDTKYGFFDKTLLNTFTILPTLYARKIAAITPKEHSITVVNERYSKIDFNYPYDIVNINYTTMTAPRAYEIADKFRKKGINVVLSGLHASVLPDEAKQHADSVLIGWGELSWNRLLEDFQKNKLKPIYQHIEYNKSIKIPSTKIEIPGFVISGAIEATRGCTYKCDFCIESNIPGGSHFFARPVDEVISEIKSLPQRFFTFYDMSLTINPRYTKELFKKMKGLNKKFSCNGNSDVLAHDKELIMLSKEAGCISWLVGFESVSQKTIDEVGKKTNKIKDYKQVVKNIHDNGMIVIGCFIFGFDSDTKEIFNNTIKTIKEIEIDIADFCILTPFPGTPIFNKFVREGRILTKNWSKYTLKNVVYKPKNMTPEELIKGIRKMYLEFYSKSYTIKRIIKSLKFGFYPFLLVLERNFAAAMTHRRLFSSKLF